MVGQDVVKEDLMLTKVETVRAELEDTSLPISLVQLLHRSEVDLEQGIILEQVGRVAANLGADNGEQSTLDALIYVYRN